MDLNQLVVFVRVVQAGSFTAAARLLGMPKSTVSSRVSQLEERLGARLLQRTTRSLGLTDAGAVYYERAVEIVAELEEAERSITELQTVPRGTLRITAPIEFSYSYLGGIIAGYARLYPQVTVELTVSEHVFDLVEQGFDLALRAGRLRPSTLVARRLAGVQMHLYASPAYLEQAGAPRQPEDLEQHACLVFSSLPEPDLWRLRRDGDERAVRVTGPLQANSLHTVRDAAVAGMGIALLPVFVGAGHLEPGGLQRVLPAWSGEGGALHVVYPSGRYLSPKVRAFVDYLVAWCADPPWATHSMLA